MEKQEFWKPIKGYRSFYEVSNLGRVRRLGGGLSRKDKILNPKKYISLSNGFNERRFLIRDLVEEAFPTLTALIAIRKKEEDRIRLTELMKAPNTPSIHVTIIERTNELLERQGAIGSINHQPEPIKVKTEAFKEHRKETKGKWFNP